MKKRDQDRLRVAIQKSGRLSEKSQELLNNCGLKFARSKDILCQGRGSAANSVVCYCLFITEVSPEQISLLFERFISRERDEPPDIDVDFEHERREEVIQYIYDKYSRKRAALAATLITYRSRSAVRDVGKALGLDPVFVDDLAKSLAWWDRTADLALTGQHVPSLAPHLDVIRIVVPALRERREDIPILAQHFLRQHARRYRKTVKEFDSAALRARSSRVLPVTLAKTLTLSRTLPPSN